jgi:hypothetical protein
MEFMFFHFLDILKSFDKCDTYINTYQKRKLLQLWPHVCIMFRCFEFEHCINILLKFSLKIQVWNILWCCIIALKELQKHKVQFEYLHKDSAIPTFEA